MKVLKLEDCDGPLFKVGTRFARKTEIITELDLIFFPLGGGSAF